MSLALQKFRKTWQFEITNSKHLAASKASKASKYPPFPPVAGPCYNYSDGIGPRRHRVRKPDSIFGPDMDQLESDEEYLPSLPIETTYSCNVEERVQQSCGKTGKELYTHDFNEFYHNQSQSFEKRENKSPKQEFVFHPHGATLQQQRQLTKEFPLLEMKNTIQVEKEEETKEEDEKRILSGNNSHAAQCENPVVMWEYSDIDTIGTDVFTFQRDDDNIFWQYDMRYQEYVFDHMLRRHGFPLGCKTHEELYADVYEYVDGSTDMYYGAQYEDIL